MAAVAIQNGHPVDIVMDQSPDDTPGASLRFSTGLILPPPEIKDVIDRTARFVARSANPPQFEERVREGQRTDPKFSFLNPADPYHAYYQHKKEKVASGEADDDTAAKAEKSEEVASTKEPVDVGVEPPAPEFVIDFPNISAVDLDIMKLTALFTARQGRSFLAKLSTREGQNYQFDFLRPTHSLFMYFNRLVEQYTKIIQPNKEMLEQLKSRTEEGARWKTLETAHKHALWEKNKREKDKQRQDDQEAERRAFAEIDWHDYAIVQTIEFTAVDSNSELPPPMSVQEVENMTLAQKRMAAMIMETTADDVEAHRAKQAAAEAEAATAVGTIGGAVPSQDADMEESDEEDEAAKKKREEDEKKRIIAQAHALQAHAMNPAAPMKIRTDYVPKLNEKKTKVATTLCTICNQQIPVDEIDEHRRIELLDPMWKAQRDALEARKAQASELQRGANVTSSLASLARTRVDIFGTDVDEERRKQEEALERERRKEREKVVWDGHTASKVSTLDKYSTNVNFDEQIAAIHRAKGLGPTDANAIGPGIGPAAVPAALTTLPPPPASLPAPPQGIVTGTYNAATVSSGPQPASMLGQQPVMLPPLHYQGMNAPQPFGYQPAPPTPVTSGPPSAVATPTPPLAASRSAALAAANSAIQNVQAGMTRTADQMEDGSPDDVPATKRQRVAKLPGGATYPEEDWITMHPHPISLRIQMPEDSSKPDWNCNGQIVTIPDLPLNLLVSTLRDRILMHTGSRVPASRIRLSYEGKMLTNSTTIATPNLEDDDLLVFSIRDPKKK